MLNFDDKRFLKIQAGAVAAAPALRQAVEACLDAGAKNIFFLGAGGAAILMGPAVQLLAQRSTFPVHTAVSAELVLGGSPHLGPGSIVVIPSLSGTTAESQAALAACKAKGATVIVLAGHADTPLVRGADYGIVNFAEDDTSSESFYLQSLAIALTILNKRGEWDEAEALLAQLAAVPEALLAAKTAFEPKAAEVAAAIAAKPYHIITGAGAIWPQAFYYGMCILEEMQWIRTRPVHASDFFHGTLELVEKGVSVIVLQGEDVYRPLTERVVAFARERTDDLLLLDTKDLRADLSPSLRALLGPALLATVLERVSAHLETQRNHPLTTRRYYKRVAY